MARRLCNRDKLFAIEREIQDRLGTGLLPQRVSIREECLNRR